MFEYRVKVRKVVDGDTVDCDIDLGFGVWLFNERIRLHGIDTPESRTRDRIEKIYGLAAKSFVKNFCDDKAGMILKCKTYDSKGKFGRIIGELWRVTNYADKSLNQYLLEKNHAVPYYGYSKEDIKEAHLKNREVLKLHEDSA